MQGITNLGGGDYNVGDLIDIENISFSYDTSFTTTSTSTIITCLTIDDGGNTFLGFANGTIKKYNSNGNQAWSYAAHTNDVTDIVIDSNGYIYTSSHDKTVKKINPNGTTTEWTYTGFDGYVYCVEVDANDNVYASGWTGSNQATRKLNNTGTGYTWEYTGQTSTPQDLSCYDGFIYAANIDDTLKKIDASDGTEVWSYSVTNPTRVVVNEYGVFIGKASGELVKLSTSKTLIWSNTEHTYSIVGLATDGNGNVYTNSEDEYIKKINSSGETVYTVTLYNSNEIGARVDSDGYLYTSGYSSANGGYVAKKTRGNYTILA